MTDETTPPPPGEQRRPVAELTGRLQASIQGGKMLIERAKPATIIMFSGGVDSTYTLLKQLRESQDELLVHHINFINRERRHEIEADRCRQIVEICQRQYRPFQYSESTLDHRSFQFFGYDMIAVGFEAGLVAHSHLMRTGRMPERWTIGNCVEEGGNPDRWKHVKACVAANCFPHPPPNYFNDPIVSKREEMEYMPSEILKLTWTCRTPVIVGDSAHECGRCMTCELMARIELGPRSQPQPIAAAAVKR